MISILFLILSFSTFAQEGYPTELVNVKWDKIKKAYIQNPACFPVTVFVNNKDYFVAAQSEVSLESDHWGQWRWQPGSIGKMEELSVLSPLVGKTIADYGPDSGESHSGNYKFSYDFTAPEGTDVFAMEEGVVFRIVQRYRVAHQDKNRMKEVNKVEVYHSDGSTAAYVHLQADSIKLKLCEKVKTGQLIGKSGHNGFSSGPHLHVDVTRPTGRGDFYSIPLRFRSK